MSEQTERMMRAVEQMSVDARRALEAAGPKIAAAMDGFRAALARQGHDDTPSASD